MRSSTLVRFLLAFLWSAFCVFSLLAQPSGEDYKVELAELEAELDALFANESDSLSLMGLIDSLLSVDPNYSEIQVRLGYSSRVTSAGRDFGVDQQGLIPGISFYHKSGLFADVSGYWNSALDPRYNITIATIGYLGRLTKTFTYGLTYDHSFYTQYDSLNTLTNSVSAALTFNQKYWYTGVDYSYSFGTETASRVVWNLTGNFKIGSFGPFKAISTYPSISLLFGNQNITRQYVNVDQLNQFENLTNRQIRRFSRSQGLTRAESMQLITARNALRNGSLTEDQQLLLESYFTTVEYDETFDLLNYYLTIPVAFYTTNFTFLVSYNYNIPRNLTNDISYDPNSYFGMSIAWNLRLN